MSVATWLQTLWTGGGAQTPTVYKGAIDGNFAVAKRLAAAFATHEQSTPNMTVRVDAGPLFDGVTLTEVAAQSTGTITAPVTNPRIDRVVIDNTTGGVSVVAGTEAASPVAPAIPAGKSPNCQVLLATSSTTITNSMITDERDLSKLGLAGALVKQTYTAFTTGGTSTAFTLTPTPAITGLTAGQRFRVKFHATAGAAPTLAVSGQAATALKVYDSIGAKVAASATTIIANMLADVEHDGVDYVILDQLPSVSAGAIISIADKTAAYTLVNGDNGKLITCSGTFTVSIAAVAGLDANWSCWVQNRGTGTITVDPNASELIQFPGGTNAGQTTMTLPYSGSNTGPYNVSAVLLARNAAGTGFVVVATSEAHGVEKFTASGTWTCPAGVTTAFATGIGGGGGSNAVAGSASGVYTGGAGSGAPANRVRLAVVPGTAYTITIGAGGTYANSGGTTSFGALLSLAGGSPAEAVDGGRGGTPGTGGGYGQNGGFGVVAGNGGDGGFGGCGRGGNSTEFGQAAAANTGAGAGGSGQGAGSAGSAGAGGSGFLTVEW